MNSYLIELYYLLCISHFLRYMQLNDIVNDLHLDPLNGSGSNIHRSIDNLYTTSYLVVIVISTVSVTRLRVNKSVDNC